MTHNQLSVHTHTHTHIFIYDLWVINVTPPPGNDLAKLYECAMSNGICLMGILWLRTIILNTFKLISLIQTLHALCLIIQMFIWTINYTIVATKSAYTTSIPCTLYWMSIYRAIERERKSRTNSPGFQPQEYQLESIFFLSI